MSPEAPELFCPAAASWPPPRDEPHVLLLQASAATDRRVLDRWLTGVRAGRAGASPLRIADAASEAVGLGIGDDPLIYPIRVGWLPPGEDGDRRWRRRDLPTLGRASGLSERSRERILAAEPDRCRIVVGDPARLSELRARMQEPAKPDAEPRLAEFVDRQARLTLDRAERALTGSRYKVPHDVKAGLLREPSFDAGIAALARETGRRAEDVRAEAITCLEEMRTIQSAAVREGWARWARFLYSRAYELVYDRGQIEQLRELADAHPLVFLPTHKSNLDGYVMASLLYEEGFPPNHTLGGINMAFWPLGPVGRRVGVIWIRRDIKGDPVYRWALRQYLAYLVKRRFNLEWYIEGGRTRTGKLLPPKMGLLHYLVDAVSEAGIRDVQIVPVSIAYDQLDEVAEMTAESRGAIKQAEGLRWLVDFARRQNTPSGRIRVNFGEPLALTPTLEAYGERNDPRLALSKLAFDVCTRINHATPVNRTGLVTLALLGVDGRSLTAAETIEVLDPLLRYAERRELPGVAEARGLRTVAGIEPVLRELVAHGVVSCWDAGPETVYAIGRENELVAAFYRNGVIHWFVNRAIGELALVGAADALEPVEAAWAEAYRLRDVLKFEFFFSDSARFQVEMRSELQLIAPEWTSGGELSLAEVGRAFADSGVLLAHRILGSFIEAYQIVAECLAAWPADAPFEQARFLADCLALGEQLRRQQRIMSGEAVSRELFTSALKLAANRKLLDGAEAGARAAFAEELRAMVRRVHLLAELDRTRTAAPDGRPGLEAGRERMVVR